MVEEGLVGKDYELNAPNMAVQAIFNLLEQDLGKDS